MLHGTYRITRRTNAEYQLLPTPDTTNFQTNVHIETKLLFKIIEDLK